MKSKGQAIAEKKIRTIFKKSLLPELVVMILITLLIAGLLFLIAL